MAELLLHEGPLAGQHVDPDDLPRHALETGVLPLRLRGHEGYYRRDEGSAGGRDWDWVER